VTGEALQLLDQVTKRYSRTGPKVVDDITLDVAAGGHILILGSNGSGKSTLLAAIAKASRPTSGVVRTQGPIGYTPERLPAVLRFTSEEYLSHMGRIRGMSRTDVDRRTGELLERLALVPSPKAPFESLSKGNRQKVIVAQAFLGDVKTVVLDEPTSGLDRASTETLADLVRETRESGGSVISSAQELPWWGEPDQVLRIWSGRLTPEILVRNAPSVQTQTLRLLMISPDDFDPSSVSRFESTQIAAVRAGGVVEITTTDRVVDSLLADLLRHGCSIRSLTPMDGSVESQSK
jgi:ABC-2 type transport system ATP-binding protein